MPCQKILTLPPQVTAHTAPSHGTSTHHTDATHARAFVVKPGAFTEFWARGEEGRRAEGGRRQEGRREGGEEGEEEGRRRKG